VRPRAILLLVLLAYLAGSLSGLSVYPSVGEDEPWIAAAPYKLATQGVLGSDLFAGFAGMERHHYENMPVYPLLEAGVFAVFGVGVVQMRLLSVLFGFLLILAVFAAGRTIADERVGVVAVLFLVGLRITEGGDATGLLLLDRARINRYDIAVPVFGLLAMLVFFRAERDHRMPWYAATGLLIALASLSHLYGVFWLPIVAGLLAAREGWRVLHRPELWLLMGGFILAWLPWVAYVATGWTDFLGQMRTDTGRFDLLNPAFYVTNVLHGNGPISLGWTIRTIRALSLGRVGTWTMLIGLPSALAVIGWRTRRQRDDPARTLALVAIAQCAMFVVLLQAKTLNYMIALWPLGALCLGWLGVWLWDRRRTTLRAGLAVLAIAITVESGGRLAHARTVAREATPYDWYEQEIARCIPPGSLVLGLQHYWLGLRQFPYRTWLLPLDESNPRFTDAPVALDAALARVDPDIILVDRYMAELFENAASPDHPYHRLRAEFQRFMEQHRAEPACVIRDRTYGTMQIYHLPK
jgi:4-amino-4-deoxy-L-arabinose transferase-like glycosyltransferase